MTEPQVRSLFIYWKLPDADAEHALTAARLWQCGLRAAHPGLAAQLYKRTDPQALAKGLTTVMESYAAPGGISAAWQAAIESAGEIGLQAFGAPQRYVEVFEAVD